MTQALARRDEESGVSLVLYDRMCAAIEAAHKVDEVKEIRDKALAFEVYSRQAQNIDAERLATDVRLRAERKAGQLLRQMDKAKGGRPRKTPGSDTEVLTLEQLGVSEDQSRNWQRLAEVPEEIFEDALADRERKATTRGIIAAGTPPDPETVPVSTEALWLWGRLRDFDRMLMDHSPAEVLQTLTPRMLDEVHSLAPRVAAWLMKIGRQDE